MRCFVFWDGELQPFVMYDEESQDPDDLPKVGDAVNVYTGGPDEKDIPDELPAPEQAVVIRREFALVYTKDESEGPVPDDNGTFLHSVYLARHGSGLVK